MEEMRKQKAGLETKRQVEFARNLLAIGRATYFARDMHDTCGEKKKAANPDTIFIMAKLRVIIKSFSFNISLVVTRSISICGFRRRQHRDRCALLSEMLQGRRLISFHIVCILRSFRFYEQKMQACHGFTYISKPVLYARANNISCGVILSFVGQFPKSRRR